jgi:hypothetical protein
MVEGVVVANRLGGTNADAARRALWSALESDGLLPTGAEASTDERVPPTRRGPARRHLRVAGSEEAA